LKAGFATSRETAQIDGDSALFRLLSAGQQSPPHQADAGEHRRPPSSTTSISASIAACHAGAADSFFGSAVM
jgi:hypothetical protein